MSPRILARASILILLPLLAAANGDAAERVQLRVRNPLDSARRDEVVVVPWSALSAMMKAGEADRLVVRAKPGRPLVFHSGAGWDQSGDFPNIEAWDNYLAGFAQRVRSSLEVSVAKE